MRDDVIAGVTNAAIVLPQGVAFAVIAGLPPEYGLFTAMITPIFAAIWGSSIIMVSGPTTAISAVLFATLSVHAAPGTPVYINMALTLTIMAGLFQILGGILRLGGLISFISHSVMIGFTTAAALLIGASQLGGALGITTERGGGVFERLERVWANLGDFDPMAALIAASSLLSIILVQKVNRKLPSYLVALIVGAGMGPALGAEAAGITMFGALPSIVPSFQFPELDLRSVTSLLPGAATIAFVGLLEAASIGRTFAIRPGIDSFSSSLHRRRRSKPRTSHRMIASAYDTSLTTSLCTYLRSSRGNQAGATTRAVTKDHGHGVVFRPSLRPSRKNASPKSLLQREA